MSKGESLQDFLERQKNFWDYNSHCSDSDTSYLTAAKNIYLHMNRKIDELENIHEGTVDMQNKLLTVYEELYSYITYYIERFSIFHSKSQLNQENFKDFFFLSLCMFIHHTKRIQGQSLTEFTYQHSHLNFNQKGSCNYFDLDKSRGNLSDQKYLLTSEATRLRQYRHRRFSKRQHDVRTPEWNAIPHTSDHEWDLYFSYTAGTDFLDQDAREALQRFNNLNNEIICACHAPIDQYYLEKLEQAYKKFQSKVNKLSYKKYLRLCQQSLEHIKKNPKYYGINLYRLETHLNLHEYTNEVDMLLASNNTHERESILNKHAAIQEIWFPELRRLFYHLPLNFELMRLLKIFRDFLVWMARLFFDKLVEDGVLGEEKNWANLILDTINEITNDVLYDPETINFDCDNNPEAENNFKTILLTNAQHSIFPYKQFYMQEYGFFP